VRDVLGQRVDRFATTTVDRQHPHQDAPEGVSNDVGIHANELAACHPFPNDSLDDVVQFVTPDDGRKFSELYVVQHLSSNVLDPTARVVIGTIQRMYFML